MSRMNVFLNTALRQQVPLNHMQENLARKPFVVPLNPPSQREHVATSDLFKAQELLTPAQEEFFLDIFWRLCHTSLPVLDEIEFRQHYETLRAPLGTRRAPSALVDIVLAIGLQYDTARSRGGIGEGCDDKNGLNTTLASWWYYRRSHALLLCNEFKGPSIAIAQCQALAAFYILLLFKT